jgi:hypothetical protein
MGLFYSIMWPTFQGDAMIMIIDIFKLVAGMRGSSTRIQQLLSLLNVPKNNKLQLAKNLGMDWKTI